MKPKNTVVLVIIAHIGLFLIWMCMGGCSINRGHDAVDEIPPKEVKIPGPGTGQIEIPTTENVKQETIVKEKETSLNDTKTKEITPPTPYDQETEIKYVVKSGDSLWKISRNFGVSEKDLMDRNDIQDPKLLREGRELYIPKKGASKAEVKSKQESATDTTSNEKSVDVTTITEETTGSKVEEKGTKSTTETTSSQEEQFITHIVVSGDTIWKLSRTYGVSTDDILKANNITDPTKIQVGQKLLIPKK